MFNPTADSTNQNLIGAVTRLRGPLTAAELGFGNIVVVEMLAFGIIALGVWLWLKRKKVNEVNLST